MNEKDPNHDFQKQFVMWTHQARLQKMVVLRVRVVISAIINTVLLNGVKG